MKNYTHKKDKFNKWDYSILVLFLILLPSIVIFLQNSNKMMNFQENFPIFEDPIIQTSTLHQLNPEFFNYSKTITIDHSKLIGSHSNFPVLISLFDSDLHDHAQNSGNDIVFYSNTQSQWLDHEIELYNRTYNGTHAQLIAWVRVPSLSNSVDTIITMYFGNSTMGSEQNPEGVWDENYVMVQHLNGSSYSKLDDSTTNNNDVTGIYDSPQYNAVGKIGNAVEFNGDVDTDGLIIDDSNSLDITTNITLSAWVKVDSITEYDKIMSKNNFQDDPWNCYAMAFNQYDSYFRMEMSDGTGGSQRTVQRPIAASLSTWYFVTVSYDQVAMRISVNGENEYANNVGSMTIATSSLPLTIGREYYNKEFLDGIIDEVRISNIARSHEWILTEYNNQHDPSNFYNTSEAFTLNTAPRVIIHTPTQFYDPPSLIINATITDDENDLVDNVKMTINASTPFNIDMFQPDSDIYPYLWECSWDNLSDSDYTPGDYKIQLTAYDDKGNFNDTEFVIVTIVKDLTAPIIEFMSPINDTSVGDPFYILANITDVDGNQPDDGDVIATIYNDVLITPFSLKMDKIGITNQWTAEWSNISLPYYKLGDYYINITAIDTSYYRNERTETYLKVTLIDVHGPNVVIDPSMPTGPFGQNQTHKEIEINATITDNKSLVTNAFAMINTDEPFNISMNLIDPIEGKWTCKWDNISEYSDGNYEIKIWAIDEVGNIDQSTSILVSIINSPNNPGGGSGYIGGGGDSILIIIILIVLISSFGAVGTYGFIKMKNNKKSVQDLDHKILNLQKDIEKTTFSLEEAKSSFNESIPQPKFKAIDQKNDLKLDKKIQELIPPSIYTKKINGNKNFNKTKYEPVSIPKVNETQEVSKVLLQDKLLKKELTKKSADEKLKLLKKIGKDEDKLD